MADKELIHLPGCTCGQHDSSESDRRKFLKTIGLGAAALGLGPLPAFGLTGSGDPEKMLKSKTVQSGKAVTITLLHTADMHAQLFPHDEFFMEDGKPVFRKRGGLATLQTMVAEIRKQNPGNTLLLDGGDCFQGSAIASLTEGQAIIPLVNRLKYDLVLPGNWEVVYGKQMLLKDMGGYLAPKVCGNMFDDETGESLFPPYQIFQVGGIKIGFVGYNDPLTPIRQAPEYSKGIRFSDPAENMSKYVRLLRDREQCTLVFALTHMGFAQQLNLAGQPHAEGVDFILGADTHERIREPIAGRYAKVTEPGAFASFISKLDLTIENGKLVDTNYALLDVDPEKYKPDAEMESEISKVYQPYAKDLQTVIGKTKTPLMRYYIIETPTDNLITDAVMWKCKPDIALSNGFRFGPPLALDPSTGEAQITRDYLWSIFPVNSDLVRGEITGRQLWDWLERELENVFASDPTRRFGGWLVRFKGMNIRFSINKPMGSRLEEVKIGKKKIDFEKVYTIVSCEREGDPDTIMCRIKDVKNRVRTGVNTHEAFEEYLKVKSPVAPVQEGRAVATDASATLLTQITKGVNYEFR